MLTRTLLLLLSALFLSWGDENDINLDKCGKTTTCYLRKSCIDGKDESKPVLELYKNGDSIQNDNCDVIIQMRYYTSYRYRVIIQVNVTETTETIAKSDISLKQKDVQFACTKNGPIVNEKYFQIENEHYAWREKLVLCAFTIDAKNDMAVSTPFSRNKEFPTLIFTLSSEQSITYEQTMETFWKLDSKCNPEDISSIISSSDVFIQKQIDRFSEPPIACEQPQFLIVTRKDSKQEILEAGDKLECAIKKWTYKSEIVPPEQIFNAVCAERICSRCAPLGNIDIAGGSEPTNGTSDEGCATTTCTDKPWMIDDGRVLNGAMKCEKDERAVTSSWYLKTANESIKVTNASCVDTRICMKKFEPGQKCPDSPSMVCITRTMSADGSEFSCTNDYKLKWISGGSSPAETESIKCDFTSGKFVTAKGNQLHTGSIVFCTKPRPPIEKAGAEGKAEKPPSSAAGTVVGGVVGGLLLLVLVVGLIVFIVIRRRRMQHKEIADTT